jgi:hypothetical protein
VVDRDTLLEITAGAIEVAAAHTLIAPTLVRSQALSARRPTRCARRDGRRWTHGLSSPRLFLHVH